MEEHGHEARADEPDGALRWRAAGDQCMARADQAVDRGDAEEAREAYQSAAAHYRRAAHCAAAGGDEGSRRADERAAVDALYASLPLEPDG